MFFKKKIVIVVLFLLLACNNNSDVSTVVEHNGDLYRVEVFQIDSGWGYNLIRNDKVFISQKIIPAINGRFTFDSAEDAEKVGAYVLNLVLTQEGFPSVSFEELDSMGVLNQKIIDYQSIEFSTATGVLPEDYN